MHAGVLYLVQSHMQVEVPTKMLSFLDLFICLFAYLFIYLLKVSSVIKQKQIGLDRATHQQAVETNRRVQILRVSSLATNTQQSDRIG